MPSQQRVYFDSSVFVAIFQGPSAPSYESSLAALTAAQQGQTVGVTSALVVAEVVGAPAIRAPQSTPASKAQALMKRAIDYFDGTDLQFVEAGRVEGIRAGMIAREWDMKGPDALHIALAEAANCALLYSLDGDHLKVGTGIPNLGIRPPEGLIQTQIPLDSP
jgi:predicted nucleic acid-binding protein